jgi:hypothetical protein
MDSSGQALWTRQFQGHSDAPAFDSDLSGNIYFAEGFNAVLRGIDPQGVDRWSTLVSNNLRATGLSANTPGTVYFTGAAQSAVAGPYAGAMDYVISKLDTAGNLLWQRQFGGTRHDETTGITSDTAGNVYVSGYTSGDLSQPSAGGIDGFVSKLDSDGNALWTRQLGSPSRDRYESIAIDGSGNIYVAGSTGGSLGSSGELGARDSLLVKYNSDGDLQWIRQFGTATHDDALDVAVDLGGDVYVIGETLGSMGAPAVGYLELVISKFDSSGNELWHYQAGTPKAEGGRSIDVDPVGNVYYAGWTLGELAGPNTGSYNIVVGKIAVPEPTTLLLAGLTVVSAGLWRRRRPGSP